MLQLFMPVVFVHQRHGVWLSLSMVFFGFSSILIRQLIPYNNNNRTLTEKGSKFLNSFEKEIWDVNAYCIYRVFNATRNDVRLFDWCCHVWMIIHHHWRWRWQLITVVIHSLFISNVLCVMQAMRQTHIQSVHFNYSTWWTMNNIKRNNFRLNFP